MLKKKEIKTKKKKKEIYSKHISIPFKIWNQVGCPLQLLFNVITESQCNMKRKRNENNKYWKQR